MAPLQLLAKCLLKHAIYFLTKTELAAASAPDAGARLVVPPVAGPQLRGIIGRVKSTKHKLRGKLARQ